MWYAGLISMLGNARVLDSEINKLIKMQKYRSIIVRCHAVILAIAFIITQISIFAYKNVGASLVFCGISFGTLFSMFVIASILEFYENRLRKSIIDWSYRLESGLKSCDPYMKTQVHIEFTKPQYLIHWKAVVDGDTPIEYSGDAESYEKFIYDVMLKQPNKLKEEKLC